MLDREPRGTTKAYYVLEWGVRPNAPIPITRALDAVEALETLVLPDLHRCTPYPPWRDGEPGQHEGLPPDALLAVGRAGKRYLVGEVDWPSGRRPDSGALWRTFTTKEIGQFQAIWRHLERR